MISGLRVRRRDDTPRRAESRVSDPVLSVRDLRTEFTAREGVAVAVRDVSFDLRRAEKVAIVGESGSGKSALGLSIVGLVDKPGKVVAGQVWLNGREISRLGDRELGRIRGSEISMVFQDPMKSLDPVKTIGDQIVEAIVTHEPTLKRAAARRRAVSLLREVEIPFAEGRYGDYPHQYSGGMRQRVMIAIALASNPDVLIADEPTTALDVTTQAQILALLGKLVEQHHTAVVFITHNLGVVAQFCERVEVMYAGRLVERSPVGKLFEHPIHPYTEALLNAVPRPDRRIERLQAIGGFPPPLTSVPPGCSFEPRCPLGHGRAICRDAKPVALELQGGEGAVIAECHFARDRWQTAAAT